MREKNQIKKNGGRKPKLKKSFLRVSCRLNANEFNLLQDKMAELNQQNLSKYIRSVLLGREIRVVTRDESLSNVIEILSQIEAQFRRVGVNYNQTTKYTHTCFGENKASSMIEELTNQTKTLIEISEGISKFCERLARKKNLTYFKPID
ncbi:MAG: plasmid mobilization protein [Bacteroidales bacterium]